MLDNQSAFNLTKNIYLVVKLDCDIECLKLW